MLEHHKHASAIVELFLLYAGTDGVHLERGCQLVVLSRVDGDIIDPEKDAIVIGRDESCLVLAHTVLLYNHTGNGVSGVH